MTADWTCAVETCKHTERAWAVGGGLAVGGGASHRVRSLPLPSLYTVLLYVRPDGGRKEGHFSWDFWL